MRPFPIALTLAGLMSFAASADPDDCPIRTAVAARHGYFTMLAINMDVLDRIVLGDLAHDPTRGRMAATNIQALARYNLPGLFIEGSDSVTTNSDGSAARLAIWQNMDDFRRKFAALVAAAAGLDAAIGDQDQLESTLRRLGADCTDCHTRYREGG